MYQKIPRSHLRRIKSLYLRQNKTQEEIGAMYNTTRARIQQLLAKMGIKGSYRKSHCLGFQFSTPMYVFKNNKKYRIRVVLVPVKK